MDSTLTFKQFLSATSSDISLFGFIINLIVSAILALILSKVYVKYGKALSNRYAFSRNFLMLTMTIMVIITIVKSSLALSLGLVGALSIVRYRTAIKEPEELAYTFLAIAIGLGMGADQAVVTIVSFILIVSFIIIREKIKEEEGEFVNLRISGNKISNEHIDEILGIVKYHSKGLSLKRFDDNNQIFEIFFSVVFESYEDMMILKSELSKIDDNLSVSYLENIGGI
jgi:multisubunit Na+/H+ antiporter MnhE subunit